MRLILSPAKKMRVDTDSFPCLGLPRFLPRTREILAALRALSPKELQALWKCSDRIAAQNVERLKNMDLEGIFTPAVMAYVGIQYQYLAPGVLSQGELEGQPCYLLHNETHGVNVLVPENGYGVQAVVEYQGQSISFEMPQFVLGYGAVSGEAALWLEDLTGDGTPELIYIYGNGGTGMWHDQVRVFDLAAMAECPVVQDTARFEGAVELEFVELRTVQAETGQDTQAVYRITGPNGEQDYAGVSLPDGGEEAARQPQPVMGYYETISLKSGQLMFCTSLSAGLTADPSFSSLGSLSAPFVYSRQTGTFTLTGPARLVVSQAALDDLSHITFSPGLDAQGAAEEFVREGYPNLFLSLPTTHPRAILRYELMDWSIREVSEDGNAVVGTFHYAFEPADWNSPEIWAGSTHMGSGEYAELAANKFDFLLCRGEDGVWTCVSVATGGVQLP